MNSFNVYGQTGKKVGGNTPIWLGTVKPIPVGAVIEDNVEDTVYRAGMLVKYDPKRKQVTQAYFNLEGFEEANAFIYNDSFMESTARFDTVEDTYATLAIVMHHPEGLLIERVYPEITEEQIQALQAQIPGVLLVRG